MLVDGRSVYSRTFSGVFWDLNEVMVSDIDRIEVIRGPGGVAWGANAMNGVISIITRPATEQQGLDVRVSAGTFARAGLGIRYGGTFGDTAYRVFSQASEHADSWQGEQALSPTTGTHGRAERGSTGRAEPMRFWRRGISRKTEPGRDGRLCQTSRPAPPR